MQELKKLKEIMDESARGSAEAFREAAALLEALERDPAAKRAASLGRENAALRESAAAAEAALGAQKAENAALRGALLEQAVDEKMGIIRTSRARTRVYFHQNGDIDAIGNIESSAKARLGEIKARAERELGAEAGPILAEAAALEERTRALIQAKRDELAAAEADLSAAFEGAYADLEKRPLDEATLRRRTERNRWEMRIGAGWLGRIGIVLILVAAGLFAYYAKDMIDSYVKGASIFAGGLTLLGFGEFLYRKRKPPFHKIFLGGGIALLYIAIFASHFFLKSGGMPIMGFGPALGFAIGASLLALLLSIRYSSRTVLALAAIGGHLPFAAFLLAYGFAGSQFYYAMAYLLVLDALVLGVGLLKDWPIASYLLFFLGSPSLAYLCLGAPSGGAGLGYACVDFGLFLAASFSGPLIRRRDFRIADLALLGLKTAIAALIAYLLFPKLGWKDFQGLITIGLSVCFLGSGLLARRIGGGDRKPMVLFLVTALAFAALAVPFQFGAVWLSLGWLIEGSLLLAAGQAYGMRFARIAGWSVLALCAAAFLAADLPLRIASFAETAGLSGLDAFDARVFGIIPLFDLKYLAITAAFIALALFFGREQGLSRLSSYGKAGAFHKGFRYAALGNLFVFACAILPSWHRIAMDAINPPPWAFPRELRGFTGPVLLSLALRLGSLAATRARWLRDGASPVIGAIFLAAADLLAAACLFYPDRLALAGPYSPVTKALAFAAMAALAALALLDLRRALIRRFARKGAGLEYYPLFMAIAAAAAGSAIIVFQMGGIGLQRGLCVSLYYLAVAVGAIAYGFVKRFSYVRFAGLGLIGLAMVILLVNALLGADTIGRILAFLAFGAVLIGISAAYAAISKRVAKAGKAGGGHEE